MLHRSYCIMEACIQKNFQQWCNDSMLASTAVDHVFEPQFDQTKDYIFGICCFSIKHATLKSKSRVNHNNVSEWSIYLQTIVSVNQHYKHPNKHVSLVQNRHHHHHLIEMYLIPLIMIQLKSCSLGIKQQSITHYTFGGTSLEL